MTPDYDEVKGSCGLALPMTEIKVVDLNTGETLGPKEKGELCVRGPQVSATYDRRGRRNFGGL